MREPVLRIGIVGAGFSGTALAANLHRMSGIPIEIVLIDKRGRFGEGEAYSTPYPFHLLNVRAQDMSAFETAPDHFVNWISADCNAGQLLEDAIPIGDQFVPRLLYGNYLKYLLNSILTDSSGSVRLYLESAEVTDILGHEDQTGLVLGSGKTIMVDKVVLALGNNQPAIFPFPVSDSINCIHNPWDFTAPEEIAANDPVLIIGTGLSMIDAVLTLYHQKHKGKIFALSRHGLLPLPHVDTKVKLVSLVGKDFTGTLRRLARHVRSESLQQVNAGGDWRSVINAVRPHVPAIWEKSSLTDRKRFLRHLLPYWNIHRHRVHNKIAATLTQLTARQLQILAGRVLEVDGGRAKIKLRHADKIMQLNVKWVINCMGPALKMSDTQQCVKTLLQQGYATLDPLKLGFATAPTGALLEASGNISSRFYSLGPPTKGMVWECGAVPEIRRQCEVLARHLLQGKNALTDNV